MAGDDRLLATALAAAPGGTGAASTTPATDEDYLVTMGAVDPALGPEAFEDPEAPTAASRTDRFEFLAFYPGELRIPRGDTVRFRRDGFHTVEFAGARTRSTASCGATNSSGCPPRRG